jgi:hypothetical protein
LAKLDVTVTYDARHGYIATALELRQPVVALSLGGLRRRIEALMVPDEPIVVLQLDGLAAAHPEPVIAVMNARRRATGQRRGWLLPLSRWRSPCWPRTSRCRTVPASCVHTG